MVHKFFAMSIIVVLCYSCNNVGNDKNQGKEKDSTTQNAKVNSALPDITGVFRLPETHCDLVITFIKGNDGYKYYIKGVHLDVEGKAIVTSENGDYYVTFDGPTGGNNKPKSLSGQYKDNTLTIQNYGNSQNQYTFFEDCPDKYLEFKKQ